MNIKLLKKLKEEYKAYQVDLEEAEKQLDVLMPEKEIYENNPIIKRYFELLDKIDHYEWIKESYGNKDYVNNSIIEMFDKNINTDEKDTNNIYVFMGYDYNDKGLMCSFYRNIESKAVIEIDISKSEEFETKNTVIKLKPQSPEQDDSEYPYSFSYFKTSFDRIRDEFIIDSVQEDQEKAIQKVLSKGI